MGLLTVLNTLVCVFITGGCVNLPSSWLLLLLATAVQEVRHQHQHCEAAGSTLGPSPCWGVQIAQGCFLPWCQSLRCRTRSWVAQDLAQEICSVWPNWPSLEHWLNSPCKSCGISGLKAAPGAVVYCKSSWLHLFPHNFFLFLFFLFCPLG